jgi:peptide-methionine (R)-S-oxide reductase
MLEKGKYNILTTEETYVIINKGTERPFSGEYNDIKKADNVDGVFVCRQCEAELFELDSKFDSGCGWPSFDDDIHGAVEKVLDKDGRRVEIVCRNCKGHLGHVFTGERMTLKDTRHCVNSLSILYIKK